MGLADSDFGKTVIQSFWWILGHMLVCVLILMCVLPVMF
jgi:hypothetical protein